MAKSTKQKFASSLYKPQKKGKKTPTCSFKYILEHNVWNQIGNMRNNINLIDGLMLHINKKTLSIRHNFLLVHNPAPPAT